MDPLRCASVGAAGYAAFHLDSVALLEADSLLKLEAVVVRRPQRCQERVDELKARGVKIYPDFDEMLRSERSLDFVALPTPVHRHRAMAVACFERGLPVLLEKPPAILIQDVDCMLEAAREYDCPCQVGFQSAFDPAMLGLRPRLLAGAIGKIEAMVVFGSWRRLDGYYARAQWAGKLRVGSDWVLDGPLNNPLIHYVHEALLMACPRDRDSLRPLTARAELYRAHPIEGEDIVCARAELEGGITLHTYLTLCGPAGPPPEPDSPPPRIEIIGESGRATWQPCRFELEWPDGREEFSQDVATRPLVFYNMVRALRGEEPLGSPLSATRNVMLHNNGCFMSTGKIWPVPAERVRRHKAPDKDDIATEVEGLGELMAEAASSRRLLSEMGVEWAHSTPTIDLDFDRFDPSGLLGE